jgi:hypothetical protein
MGSSDMTAAELLASVPIHRPGSGAYVVLAEIAQPWRDQFTAALRGSAAPLIDGAGPCAWAHDWQQWVAGTWHHRPGPFSGTSTTRGRVTIPETSPQRYIGGMAALNLPSPEGTGDWHMEQTFFREREHRSRSFISGVGCPTDTTHVLGQAGIYDCTAVLAELGIPHEGTVAYAANHARAIVDLVLGAVLRSESPEFVVMDDWMPRACDKRAVLDLLTSATQSLTPAQKGKVLAWQARQANST